jgi:hypothetical protein
MSWKQRATQSSEAVPPTSNAKTGLAKKQGADEHTTRQTGRGDPNPPSLHPGRSGSRGSGSPWITKVSPPIVSCLPGRWAKAVLRIFMIRRSGRWISQSEDQQPAMLIG